MELKDWQLVAIIASILMAAWWTSDVDMTSRIDNSVADAYEIVQKARLVEVNSGN